MLSWACAKQPGIFRPMPFRCYLLDSLDAGIPALDKMSVLKCPCSYFNAALQIQGARGNIGILH